MYRSAVLLPVPEPAVGKVSIVTVNQAHGDTQTLKQMGNDVTEEIRRVPEVYMYSNVPN